MNPFAELDAIYSHILSSVDDIQLTLRVLSLYVASPPIVFTLSIVSDMLPEHFLSLEPGDIQLALINLSSIVTYDESSGEVDILHASFIDFLSDRHRSTKFYIDMGSTHSDFVHRILQCVKGPDGMRVGDLQLFRGLSDLSPWIQPTGQLLSEILNFDLDAFINASIKRIYRERPFLMFPGNTIDAFDTWESFLDDAGLEDGDKKKALDQINKSFDSRLQSYRSDWRLQLLLTLTVSGVMSRHVVFYEPDEIPYCRFMDILLEMDDHNLHLADQNALDLRHTYMTPGSSRLIDIMISPDYVGVDSYASAALHCMRFLSNPPKYSERNERSEMGLIHAEWKATCSMTLGLLCKLLQRANTSPALVEFTSNHDVHPAVKRDLSADRVLWNADMHILAFLSRASGCANWRIVSAIQRSRIINDQPTSKFDENDENSDKQKDSRAIGRFIKQRLDQCCLNGVHFIP